MGMVRGYGLRVASWLVAGAVLAPVAGAAGGRTVKHELALRMPPPHETRTTHKTVRVPARLKELYVSMQLRGPDGRLSPPIFAGDHVDYMDDAKRPLARVTLTARYDGDHHRVRYAVAIENLNVSRRSYKRVRARLVVTVRYSGKRTASG